VYVFTSCAIKTTKPKVLCTFFCNFGPTNVILHNCIYNTGGSFGTPHAASHCVVLPHAIAYNNDHAPEACARICAALGVDNSSSSSSSSSSGGAAAAALYALQKRLGAPTSLRELGLPEEDLMRLVSLVVSNTENYAMNPAPFEKSRVEQLVRDAWRGDPPGTMLVRASPASPTLSAAEKGKAGAHAGGRRSRL
jgi:hypothetical protein